MFDMTPFTKRGDDSFAHGAVIEFRSAEEHDEFAEYFNRNTKHLQDMIPFGYSQEYLDGYRLYTRIFLREDGLFQHFRGPSRSAYERAGLTILSVDDIRIGRQDLGDLSSGEVNLESLFSA